MRERWYPNWRTEPARRMRRAHERWDREPAGHFAQGGFGYPDGFHGAYAERPGYVESFDRRHPAEPVGHEWPNPTHTLSRESMRRHRRAMEDREIAHEVDLALYDVIGPAADGVAVYADDAVITLRGELPHPRAVELAEDVAWETPGVRRVRNALRVRM